MSPEASKFSGPERKRFLSLALTHSDLVTTKRYSGPFIEPREIPLYPLVYESLQVYTPDFVERVRTAVPASIQQDIETIKGKIGEDIWARFIGKKPLPLIKDSTQDQDEAFLERFYIEIDPQRQVWVNTPADAINLGLDRLRPDLRKIFLPFNHPTPKSKLDKYRVDPHKYRNDFETQGVIGWYAHNYSMADLSTQLYLRNFAIQFNNLGLQEVVK